MEAVEQGQRDGEPFRPGGLDVLAQQVVAICAEEEIDVAKTRRILDEDHYDLEKIKDPTRAQREDIDRTRLPSQDVVTGWSGPEFAAAIRHVPTHPAFNPSLRQLLHVSFKVAAKHGSRYTDLLRTNREIVARQVTDNIFDRHLAPLFLSR